MKFDKSRVYTAINADELKIGSKVIIGNTIDVLRNRVQNGTTPLILSEIKSDRYEKRFRVAEYEEIDSVFSLVYLVSEPEEKKLEWTDLKIGDVIIQKRIVDMIDTAGNGNASLHIRTSSENDPGSIWLSDGQLRSWERVHCQYLPVNLNEHIKIKLTPEGEKIRKAYYGKGKANIPTELIPKLTPDKDGYVEYQLWDFMLIFGQHFHMGVNAPCDLNCLIEVRED